MALLTKIPGGEAKAPVTSINLVPSDVSAALKDAPIGGRLPQENGIRESPVVSYIADRYQRSLMARRPYEQLWLEAHRNYRGLYGPDVQFTATEKSRVFIRVTKTKVNSAYGQLMDVLFADNKFPITVDPQRLPEGVVDTVSIETNPKFAQLYQDGQQSGQSQGSPQQPPQQGGQQSPQIGNGMPGQGPMPPSPTTGQGAGQTAGPPKPPPTKVGFPGDGTRDNEPVLQSPTLDAITGPLHQNESVHAGAPKTPSAVEIDAAQLSAKKMEKKIQDQLRMSEGDKHLRHAAFECVNLGTACLKGPIAVNKIIEGPDGTGMHVKVPAIEAVSIWNMYPDPDGRATSDCDYMIQRHKLNMSQLRGLKQRPGFRANEIDNLIAGGFNYQRQWWEPMLQDMPMVQPMEKFEVLEFWGMIDKALAVEFGIDLPPEFAEVDEVPINIWISGHHILRFMINPFNNGRLPYYLIPYEIQPYTIWGIGVSETMNDSQTLMNGFMRLAVDNAVLSGNMIFEIDESALVPGQSYDLYPGKFFRRMGGQQGQAIFPHDFPNTAQANMQLYDKARELADEATFPSYTHGNTSVNPSLGRTSSGLSMMMSAASVGIRMAIKNFDDYLLTPLGEAFFEFNKATTDDPELKGNFIIVAGGTDSLMRNEVKSQRLVSLIQLLQNPMLAPFAKWPYLIREVTQLMELDPDKATNTDEETIRMALLLQSFMPPPAPGSNSNPAQPGKPPQQQQQGSPTNPKDHVQSGPKTGTTSLPGETAFTANKNTGPGRKHAPAGQGVS